MADPQPQQPKTWDQIASTLDPNMPAQTYDLARRHYFDNVVKPRLTRQDNPMAAWDHFESITRRAPMAKADSIALSAGMFVTGAAKGVAKPILQAGFPEDRTGKKVVKGLDLLDEKLQRMGVREGKSTLPATLGEFAGSVVPFTLGGELVEAAELPALVEAGWAQRAIHGGLTFGAFEAANAKEGDRLVMGLKGAAMGAALEGPLGLLGKLRKAGISDKEVDKVIAKAMASDLSVPPEVDEAVSQEVKKSAKVISKEPRPKVVQENANIRGTNVLVTDASGAPQIVKVGSGYEDRALHEVGQLVKAGGSVDGIHFHPDDWSTAQRFMAKIADQVDAEFKGARVIRTAENHAPRVAAELNLNEVKAEATGPSEVVVENKSPRKPSHTDLQAKMFELKDEGNYSLSKGARDYVQSQVEKLWSEAVPNQRKEEIAKSLANWDLSDVIPPEWVREVEVGEEVKLSDDPNLSYEDRLIAKAKEAGYSEAEVSRMTEIADRAKKAKSQFQDIGSSAAPPQPAKLAEVEIPIPESERSELSMGPNGIQKAAVSVTARRIAIKTSREMVEGTFEAAGGGEGSGVGAFVGHPSLGAQILDDLNLPPQQYLPVEVHQPSLSKMDVYHEGLHVDAYHVPEGRDLIAGRDLADTHLRTMDDIAQGLLQGPYGGTNLEIKGMREEAFVHAASAIRTGNDQLLFRLVAFDTSTGHVLRMVSEVAEDLLEGARAQDWYGPARVVQRKMQDLLLRTSPERTWELRSRIRNLLSDAWYDPDTRGWKAMGTDGSMKFANDLNHLADIVNEHDGTSVMPSFSTEAEMRGVRGPFGPRGSAPVKDPGPMDTAPDVRWKGWTSISGLFRPMQPWVADLHERVNAALRDSSKATRYFPIFDRWKDLSEADRAWETTAHELYDSAANLLEGAGKKQYDYFEVLMTEPKYWKDMAEKLNLDEADLNKISGINQWLGDFRDKTHINPFNYLRDELPRLRGHNYNSEMVYGGFDKDLKDMSTFERLQATGKLDPKNRHIGSFMDTLIREARMKELQKPMTELRSLVDKKAKDGSYVLGNMRYPLDNYLKYMSGIPDVTSQVMKTTVSDFQRMLGERAAQMNKFLPEWAQLPTEFQYPGAIINKLMVWSYAAGLGLRASIPVRDALQVFSTTLPVLGPTRFLRGLTYFAQNGFKLAEESGALLERKNMGDLYGDIFSELPPGASTDRITKLAQKLLSPSRGGHNIGRAVGFYGEYFDALDAINDYRAGKIDLDQLVKDRTHLWFNDKAVASRMIDLIHTVEPEEAAKKIALEMTDITLWPYRRGMQPTLLRTGAGRIFGQFGMWPMNYLDFIRRGSTKFAEYPQQATRALALWGATNYAATSAMNGIGADASKWFWVSPAGYGLSPHAQFVLDLGKSWEETPDGRAARKRVLEYPLDFFPAGIEARNIESVLATGAEPFDSDGKPTPDLLKVLGFKPLKEGPDRSAEDQIKFELGLGGERKPQ